MRQIGSMARKSEGSWVQLKTDLRVELKAVIEAYEARVVAQVDFVRDDVNHIGRTVINSHYIRKYLISMPIKKQMLCVAVATP